MSESLSEDRQQQRDELELLEAMRATEEEFFWEEKGGIFEGEIRASVELEQPVSVKLAVGSSKTRTAARNTPALNGQQSQSATVAYLPPLCLRFLLPADYPSSSPPSFTLTSSWLNFSQVCIIFSLGLQLLLPHSSPSCSSPPSVESWTEFGWAIREVLFCIYGNNSWSMASFCCWE